MPSVRSLVIALLLGAAAGATAALWVTLDDAKGLVTSVASSSPDARRVCSSGVRCVQGVGLIR
jgi:hypothetical protein